MNVCSDIVLQQPKLVAQAGKSNLVVFTWGLLNNEYGNILAQQRMGVHAIIYDRWVGGGGDEINHVHSTPLQDH